MAGHEFGQHQIVGGRSTVMRRHTPGERYRQRCGHRACSPAPRPSHREGSAGSDFTAYRLAKTPFEIARWRKHERFGAEGAVQGFVPLYNRGAALAFLQVRLDFQALRDVQLTIEVCREE